MCSSFICVIHFVNGAKFLNATLAFSLPPVAVISPVTRIYACEYSQRIDLIFLVSKCLYHFHPLRHSLDFSDHE